MLTVCLWGMDYMLYVVNLHNNLEGTAAAPISQKTKLRLTVVTEPVKKQSQNSTPGICPQSPALGRLLSSLLTVHCVRF